MVTFFACILSLLTLYKKSLFYFSSLTLYWRKKFFVKSELFLIITPDFWSCKNDVKTGDQVTIPTTSKESHADQDQVVETKGILTEECMKWKHGRNSKSLVPTEKSSSLIFQTLCENTDNGHKFDEINKNEINFLNNLLTKNMNVNTNLQCFDVYPVHSFPQHPAQVSGIPLLLLKEEKCRLLTFVKYPPNAAKSAILLAAEGFAYIGRGERQDDLVKCCFCGAVKNNWQASEDISKVHRQLSPACSMVTNTHNSNIPLTTSMDSSLFEQVIAYYNSRQQNSLAIVADSVRNSANSVASISADTLISNTSATNASHTLTTSITTLSPPSSNSEIIFSTSTPGMRSSSESLSSMPSTSGTVVFTIEPTVAVGPSSASSSYSLGVSLVNPVVSSSLISYILAQPSVAAGPNSTDVSPAALTQAVEGSNQGRTTGSTSYPSYSDLGIITERPQRCVYALLPNRLETFRSWPRDHHLRPKELAEVGFYYAGYGENTRCFYCGGNVYKWKNGDDVWVEHARRFPNCAYIRQHMGQEFVDTVFDIVQELGTTHLPISYRMVLDRIDTRASSFQLNSSDNKLKRDPAVKTVVDVGFPLKEVMAVAKNIKENRNILSADLIYKKLIDTGVKRNQATDKMTELEIEGAESETNIARDVVVEKLRKLKEQNDQLRQQTLCKICMEQEMAVVFLPCGHFVSCIDCAAAVKNCPVCRKKVKGIVRAFIAMTTSVTTPTTSTRNNTITLASTSSRGVSIVNTRVSPSFSRTTIAESSVAAGHKSVAMSTTSVTQGATGFNQVTDLSERAIKTKRLESSNYALFSERVQSFVMRPRDHHIRPQELAEAGFYYAGYDDCVKYFCCGIQLHKCEDEDDFWVEHARLFPECAYIHQKMGQEFVDIVQELNKTTEKISFSMVMDRIRSATKHDSSDNKLKRDTAVKILVDMGFPLKEVMAVAKNIKENRNILSADLIYKKLIDANVKRNQATDKMTELELEGAESETNIARDVEKPRKLKEQNDQLYQQTLCKICMEKEIVIVFLPCGHFVSCIDCAATVKNCPVCRNEVKGIVRALIESVYNLQQIPIRRLCCNCYDQPRVALFMPCGHLYLCLDCGIGVRVCSRCDSIVHSVQHVRWE